jgi:hypothetical protein
MEILVSVAIFSIVIVFLYKSLNMTQKGNIFFNKQVAFSQDILNFKMILTKDILNSTKIDDTNIYKRYKNLKFKLKSSNTYHKNSFQNIAYIVSKKGNLLRVESKKSFSLDDVFFQNAFIDIVLKDVKSFEIIDKNQKNVFIFHIKLKNDTDIITTIGLS